MGPAHVPLPDFAHLDDSAGQGQVFTPAAGANLDLLLPQSANKSPPPHSAFRSREISASEPSALNKRTRTSLSASGSVHSTPSAPTPIMTVAQAAASVSPNASQLPRPARSDRKSFPAGRRLGERDALFIFKPPVMPHPSSVPIAGRIFIIRGVASRFFPQAPSAGGRQRD